MTPEERKQEDEGLVKVVFLGQFFRHAGKVWADDFIAVYARLLAQLRALLASRTTSSSGSSPKSLGNV